MEAYKAETAALLTHWRNERQEAINAFAAAQFQVSALTKIIDGLEQLYPELAANVDVVPRLPESPATVITQTSLFPQPEQGHPDTQLETGKDAPRATDVVRQILQEQPSRWFGTGDMVREFRSRGVDATPTAIRLALRRTNGRQSEMRETDNGQLYRFHSGSTSSETPEAL